MNASPSAITAQASAAAAGMSGSAGATTQTCPAVTLEIGVFFDGTGNNMFNAGHGREGSYGNARSNVALLSALYKNGDAYDKDSPCGAVGWKHARLYVPGIGTVSGGEDATIVGQGLGQGPTGVEARVFKACLDIGAYVNRLSPGVEPTEIVLDVFGFSRGAAAARYFVNCFRQGYVEYRKAFHLTPERAHLPPGRKVRFRFVGIFDTVVSIGLETAVEVWSGLGDASDNGPVNVNLSTAQADKIQHLTAATEYRAHFPLTRNTPGGGDTRELPGAHSDVGGGYATPGDEVVVDTGRTYSSPWRSQAEALRNQLIERAAKHPPDASLWISEGWITGHETDGGLVETPGPMKVRQQPLPNGMTDTVYSFETGTRLVRPWVQLGLSRIALRIMYDKAVAAGVPFTSFPTSPDYTPPPGLQPVAAKLIGGGSLSASERRQTLHDYGHVSARADATGMEAAPGHVRVRFPNRPGEAK